jgi:hypothetical protein
MDHVVTFYKKKLACIYIYDNFYNIDFKIKRNLHIASVSPILSPVKISVWAPDLSDLQTTYLRFLRK